jgi:predicted RNase H-like nuclease (RuvC/YqgF family)
MTIKAPEAITQGKRYWWAHDTGRMTPAYEGTNQFVLASDFDTLQSSLERTERELREARELLTEMSRQAAEYKGERDALQQEAEALISNAATEMHKRESAERENQRLREALKDLQDGIATYLADPLRKKTYVHAEVFIELCGERIAAALSNPSNPEKGES